MEALNSHKATKKLNQKKGTALVIVGKGAAGLMLYTMRKSDETAAEPPITAGNSCLIVPAISRLIGLIVIKGGREGMLLFMNKFGHDISGAFFKNFVLPPYDKLKSIFKISLHSKKYNFNSNNPTCKFSEKLQKSFFLKMTLLSMCVYLIKPSSIHINLQNIFLRRSSFVLVTKSGPLSFLRTGFN